MARVSRGHRGHSGSPPHTLVECEHTVQPELLAARQFERAAVVLGQVVCRRGESESGIRVSVLPAVVDGFAPD